MRWRVAVGLIMLCALTILVTAWAVAAQQPANWVVVPGHAIGDIQLGMTHQQVLNRLGMPDEISNDRSSDGSRNIYWVYPQGTDRQVLVVSWTKRQDDMGGVDFIFTDYIRFVTSKGVTVGGSNFKDLITHYGMPERMSGVGRGAVMLYYEGQGIRFRVDGEGGKVNAVTIVPRK